MSPTRNSLEGDGVTDDTNAINAAIAASNNCGQGSLSSSTKGTLVYFPPGTYLISSPINAYYYSQLVGYAIAPPTIKTSQSFIGLGAIQADVHEPNSNGDDWYIWATSLMYISIFGSKKAGNNQRLMFTENGSSGFMFDVDFYGGKYGPFLLWDWGWMWQQISIYGTPIGILLQNPESKAAYEMNPDLSDTSVIVLDDIGMNGVLTVLALANGAAAAIAPGTIDFYLFGNMNNGPSKFGSFGLAIPHPDDSLAPDSTPLYARHAKSFGAKGDGTTDDTAAIQNALNSASDSNVIYFPSGSYIITSTVKVPSTCRITGRVWSQLVAKGSTFADMLNPTPMIQVGQPGDTGTVEFSDMIFTSIGPLPGLVMVDWNVAASKTGCVGMWDTHFRVGGAIGTKLQAVDCLANQPIQFKCIAASVMLHITPSGNGYFENVWAWVADHGLDDAANTQITVAVARGILVESQGPTWLYETASEQCMLYQYNFEGSVNTFAGMIQTESPYFQYTSATTSPGPFDKSVGLFPGDPNFSSDTTCASNSLMCNFSWAQRIFLNNGGNEGFRLFNLITIGSVEMLSAPEDDLVIYAKDNTQVHSHPFWSMLAGYLDDGADDEVVECNDDEDSPACNGTPLCDFSQDFATLDEDTIGQFASADNGYDALYGYYVESVKNSVPTALSTFMTTNGGPVNQYFTCTLQAIHSGTGGNLGKPITHTCPMTVKDFGFNEAFTIAYTLNNEDGFFNVLESQYVIEKDWVKFDTQYYPIFCPQGASCFGQGIEYLNYPMASDKTNVANPKDTVTAALANMPATQKSIAAREADIMGGQWTGSTSDIVSVVSMPVMMLQQAIDSMNNAKALAKTQKAED
ncbi:hypothetical protein MBLNU13_g06604t2 [Cladosporium sp. NU13]